MYSNGRLGERASEWSAGRRWQARPRTDWAQRWGPSEQVARLIGPHPADCGRESLRFLNSLGSRPKSVLCRAALVCIREASAAKRSAWRLRERGPNGRTAGLRWPQFRAAAAAAAAAACRLRPRPESREQRAASSEQRPETRDSGLGTREPSDALLGASASVARLRPRTGSHSAHSAAHSSAHTKRAHEFRVRKRRGKGKPGEGKASELALCSLGPSDSLGSLHSLESVGLAGEPSEPSEPSTSNVRVRNSVCCHNWPA